jgi:PEP-CTERM motif
MIESAIKLGVRAALLSVAAFSFNLQPARAATTLVESWENTLDGWTVSGGGVGSSSFSSTQGVTDGSFSLDLTYASSPNYGTPMSSANSSSLTSILANNPSVSLDVFTPSSSFGFYLQIQLWVNNADTGYFQDGDYISTTIGSETTITFPNLPAAQVAILAASSNPTQIGFQIGGGGAGDVFLDNLRVQPVPEPGTLALLGLGALCLLRMRGRR